MTPEKVTFGHYEITTRDDGSHVELGRGMMGITYRAWDTSLECPVALKVINTMHLRSPGAGQRLVREARAAARLRHRNVASVFHLGMEKDVYFYAMELLDGETIEARVNREGPFNVATTLQIATQVARALNAAQEHHLVHRDIKPANLMLVMEDDEMIVKVIDFGLAKAGAKTTPDAAEVPGFMGTPHFASPEQMQERELDGRSDIYSLGVSMWFMLTGCVPFGGPLAQVMSQQLNMEPPYSMLAHAPPSLVALIRKMLSKNPDERPSSAAALRKQLEQVSEEMAGTKQAAAVAQQPVAGKDARGEKYSTAYRTGVILQGRYRIVGELGEEKLGRAFQVDDAELLRAARLVLLHRYLVEDTALHAQLQEEVTQAVPLEHPNLLRVYGLEQTAQAHLLLVEWTNGFSLLDLLRNRRKLDACEAIPLIKHVAIGLDYALRTGLKLVSLSLGETFIHFADTENVPSETMLLQRPVSEWPGFHVRLHPLAGVRDAMPGETWGGNRTVVAGMHAAAPAHGGGDLHDRYIREFSALTYELLGGTGTFGERYGPLAAISEEGNEVLRLGLAKPRAFPTARSFVEALMRHEGTHVVRPAGTAGEDVRFQCGNCGQWMVIDAEARGADLECPTCGKRLTVPQAIPAAHVPREPRLKPKILIVEDNELSRDMLSRRLQRRQYEVVLAIDGVEGLQMAQLERPDLILMDMNLPLISGWQVTRQLKSMPGMRDLPIIALTAYATLDDEDKAREAGCDDFEPKPLELPRLLQKIEAQLQKAAPRASSSSS